MATGLKVYNASGVVTLDTSTRVARLISVINYTLPSAGGIFQPISVNVTVAGIANDGTWAALAIGQGHSAKVFSGYVEVTGRGSYSDLNGRLIVVRF